MISNNISLEEEKYKHPVVPKNDRHTNEHKGYTHTMTLYYWIFNFFNSVFHLQFQDDTVIFLLLSFKLLFAATNSWFRVSKAFNNMTPFSTS